MYGNKDSFFETHITCCIQDGGRPTGGSKKKILTEMRAMKLQRWSTATIEEIAKMLNPKLSGWVNYFGRYGRRELSRVLRAFHTRLIKWVLNRYKSLNRSKKKAYAYLKQLQKGNPIFYHWKKGFVNL